MEIRENYPLRDLNTFHIDAAARYFTKVSNDDELRTVINDPLLGKQNKFVLGGGSNILFTSAFPGLVIKNDYTGMSLTGEDADHYYVRSGAGEVWHSFVMFCIRNNYAGIENLSLIPGSVGAGPIQNIGAYGVELKDVFYSLTAMDLTTGETKTLFAADCRFGYRNSIFKNELKDRMVITSVTLRLNKVPVFNTSYGAIEQELVRMGVKDLSIAAISEAVCYIRRSKLPDPDVLGNCGSFFKNPEIDRDRFNHLKASFPAMVGYDLPAGKVKVAAGWLIEQCGWKGKRVGHTGSHKDQALVLVNYGDATGQEILKLSKDIQQSVIDKFGIPIDAEVNIL